MKPTRIDKLVKKQKSTLAASTPTSSSTESASPGPADPNCPICHGKGFYYLDVPVGHPDYGKAVPCQCTLRHRRAQQMEQWRHLSNMQALLKEMTFATFRPEGAAMTKDRQRNLRTAYDIARNYAANPQGWLFLLGGYGCGKTHLAAAIANEMWQHGEDALFIVVPDLLDHLRATFRPDSTVSYDERFELVRTVPLLILDDLGAQSNTPWANEKLYQIINYRYNASLPMVVTTNLSLEEIEPRTRSRLLDTQLTTIHYIIAPDYRGSGRAGSEAELNLLPLLRDWTFATWADRKESLSAEDFANLRRAYAEALTFAEKPEGCLLFSGLHGVGKTHLAAAIANYRSERGDRVLFITVPDFLDHLRAAFSPQSQVPYDKRFQEVKTAPFLVLDDFDTKYASPWAREKLFQLFNYRYLAKLPTVMTSSTAIEEMESRLLSRLLDNRRCAVFGIAVPPYLGSLPFQKEGKTRQKKT